MIEIDAISPAEESDDGLFVTDAELIRRLNVPRKLGYRAIRDLEKQVPGRPKFPGYDPLFPGRRFWPAVQKYFMLRHENHWQENVNATAEAENSGRDRNAGPQMETPKKTLERVLDRASGHRRPRISHKKPVLVVHRNSADVDA